MISQFWAWVAKWLEDKPYRHPETGDLRPCGCGCGDTP